MPKHIHSETPAFQWYTPCGQLLVVQPAGKVTAHIGLADGSHAEVPELAMAHILQWAKAHLVHEELMARAQQRRDFIQSSMARVDEHGKLLMHEGLASYYEELHRCNMNAANMKTIRDVAIQRALVAIDRAMMGRQPEHGHFAPVVALGRTVPQPKKDY